MMDDSLSNEKDKSDLPERNRKNGVQPIRHMIEKASPEATDGRHLIEDGDIQDNYCCGVLKAASASSFIL